MALKTSKLMEQHRLQANILMVDDIPENLRPLNEMLTEQGYRASAYNDQTI